MQSFQKKCLRFELKFQNGVISSAEVAIQVTGRITDQHLMEKRNGSLTNAYYETNLKGAVFLS